jgi:hypothetical protein
MLALRCAASDEPTLRERRRGSTRKEHSGRGSARRSVPPRVLPRCAALHECAAASPISFYRVTPARNVGRVGFRGVFQTTCVCRLASRHPGRSALSREPFSVRRASGFSLEDLLLSPRSAPARVPARAAPGLRHLFLLKIRAATAYTRQPFIRRYRWRRPAPAFRSASSIFEATPFGEPAVTHCLDGSSFHGHVLAVCIGQHSLWALMRGKCDAFAAAIGSSHIASPDYQEWPTGRARASAAPQRESHRCAPHAHC